MCHGLMCTWVPGTEKGVLRGYRLGIAKIHLIILQIWSADTVVLCQKAASRNNSSAELESAERQAKQCKFTWVSMETPFSNDTNLSQGSFDSLNNSSGEINSAERQSKWRKFKWTVNENMQGKDVKAASETNMFTGTCLPLLRIPFSADHSVDIKKNTF